jgi:hypothetical protein
LCSAWVWSVSVMTSGWSGEGCMIACVAVIRHTIFVGMAIGIVSPASMFGRCAAFRAPLAVLEYQYDDHGQSEGQ